MFIMRIAAAGLLGVIAASALAQAPPVDTTGYRAGLENGDRDSLPRSNKASNIVGNSSPTNVAPTLPSPNLGPDAPIRDYLRSARAALVAGETGKAQQSLEMAETRSLNAAEPSALPNQQTTSQMANQIRSALISLGSGDSPGAIRIIDVALAN